MVVHPDLPMSFARATALLRDCEEHRPDLDWSAWRLNNRFGYIRVSGLIQGRRRTLSILCESELTSFLAHEGYSPLSEVY